MNNSYNYGTNVLCSGCIVKERLAVGLEWGVKGPTVEVE